MLGAADASEGDLTGSDTGAAVPLQPASAGTIAAAAMTARRLASLHRDRLCVIHPSVHRQTSCITNSPAP